jgi:hypothetical protein
MTMMSCADNFNGTTSPLKLRQLSNTSETEKSADGSAFLFFASYHSEERNVDYVKVFAEVDGEYRFLEIPMEDIRIKIDSTVKVPYVQIEYTYDAVKKHQFSSTLVCEAINPRNIYARVNIVKYIIICPEQYLPERLLPIDVTK